MKKIIDVSKNEVLDKYENKQYVVFLRLASLFEEFIFGIDLSAWKDITKELENTLCKCDEINYQNDSTALAYSLWHFLDRYHRVQIMCKFLLENNYLNYPKQYDLLDVGTGPSQILFALSDHFQILNQIHKDIACTVNPDYVEQSEGFRNFLHHFVEFSLSKGVQYLVPFHLGRTKNAFDLEFDEKRIVRFQPNETFMPKIKYRYDITFFNNFLTTKDSVSNFAGTLRKVCKYTRNHGLIVVIGASEKLNKYQKIYPMLDKIILEPVRDRVFYCRWKKVFNESFHYEFEDTYGKVIRNHFRKIMEFLQTNKLWEELPQSVKNELQRNANATENNVSNKKGTSITWKMVVYEKTCRPKFKRMYKPGNFKNFKKISDDIWKREL